MVAQIDEQHAAMVADTMAPARQPDGLVDIAVAERAAGVGPVTMHGNPENRSEKANRSGKACPRQEGQGLPEAAQRGNRSRRGFAAQIRREAAKNDQNNVTHRQSGHPPIAYSRSTPILGP